MPLPTASRLGHYEVLSQLGAGGMGEVYRARDTRLGREVALKVLKQGAVDERSRKEFLREARATSALNHPNIVTVYDVGSDEGVAYIAMEYVRGKTLRDIVARKRLALSDVLHYAIPLADAISQAHSIGITHRDIKPGNIIVNEEGVPKLLDFGLAKFSQAQEAPSAGAETMTMDNETGMGLIVGTARYMSPEQAQGLKVDGRSDIFSFGLVLYEMLTGKEAYSGTNVISIVSAIIHTPPPPLPVSPGLPAELSALVMRCLRKDPSRRYQHAGDLRIALEEIRDDPAVKAGKESAGWMGGGRLKWAAMGGLAVAVAGVAGMLWRGERSKPLTPYPALKQVTYGPGLATTPAVSGDGKLIAYASDRAGGNLDIWVQQIGGGEAIRLTADAGDEYDPVFSPDGRSLVFRSDADGGGLYTVSTLGGQVRRIAKDGRRPRFSPDGNWIGFRIGHPHWTIASGSSIHIMPATGGPSRRLEENFFAAGDLIWAPDSKHYLFVGVEAEPSKTSEGRSAGRGGAEWRISSIDGEGTNDSGALRILGEQGIVDSVPGAWTADGKYILLRGRSGDAVNIWRLPISTRTWKITGPAEPVTTGFTQQDVGTVSDSGLLSFSSANLAIDIWSLPIDGSAGATPLRLTADSTIAAPSASATGDRIVFQSLRSGNPDIWMRDGKNGETQITSTPFAEFTPILSPNGSRVVYRAREREKNNIYFTEISADGRPGVPQKVCERCGAAFSWSPDGATLLDLDSQPVQVFAMDLASGQKKRLVSHPSRDIWEPRFSSDGRWFLFLLHGPGKSRIYAAPYRGREVPESEWIPITDGMSWEDKPRWSPDGLTVYFTSDRDGYQCVWGQHVDAFKHAVGAPFAVYHSHNSRLALSNVHIGALAISVTKARLIFNQGEKTGNVWVMPLPAQ